MSLLIDLKKEKNFFRKAYIFAILKLV